MLADMGLEGGELSLYMTALDQVYPQYMINALDWMKQNYGSAIGYITTELNIT